MKINKKELWDKMNGKNFSLKKKILLIIKLIL
jgi:hypothetical protein